ncbi:unnamed protein product [Schistosoma turkestanicum]|nr:unnamed protein product [Schistosoma turkestanicum]
MEELRNQRLLENLDLLKSLANVCDDDMEKIKRMYGIKMSKSNVPRCQRIRATSSKCIQTKNVPKTLPCRHSKKRQKVKVSLSSNSDSDWMSSGDEWIPDLPKPFVTSTPTHKSSHEKMTKKASECSSKIATLMEVSNSEEGRRYPKREKERRNYKFDVVIPEDDRYLYCYTCKRSVIDGCFDHPIIWIDNTPSDVCEEVKDKYIYCQTSKCVCGEPFYKHAAKTAPKGLITISKSRIHGAGLGAYANANIQCGTIFGHYEGQIVYLHEMDNEERVRRSRGGYAWLVRANNNGVSAHLVDARNPLNSNWLRFVNCARFEEEQNLVTVQYRGKIYYRACKDISRFEELLTYYGEEVCFYFID